MSTANGGHFVGAIPPIELLRYTPAMLSETQALPEDPAELRLAAEGLVSLVKPRRYGSPRRSRRLRPTTSYPTATAKGVPKRKPLPAHLPCQETLISPCDACAECGGRLKPLGEDVTEELDYVPGRFVVNRIVQPRLACSCEAICQAPLPSRPIERGRPGPGLLAHVLVAKYGDHLPRCRQSQIFEREGIDLDRSTLADWVGTAASARLPASPISGASSSTSSRLWRPAMNSSLMLGHASSQPVAPKPADRAPNRACCHHFYRRPLCCVARQGA